MKAVAIHVAMLLAGMQAFAGAARGEGVHPIVKVVKMLEGLKGKTTMMGKVEADAYARFQGWCNDQSSTLKKAIEDEESTISELGDTINGKTKEQKGLENQIGELSDQIMDLEASALKAKQGRSKEAALFTTALADYKGTIKAVADALAGVQKAGVETKTGLLQAQAKAKQALAVLGVFATEQERAAIDTFVQEDVSTVALPLASAGDKAAALDKYNFKSGNIVELLKAMKSKFEAEKVDATKAETNAVNAYELSSTARTAATEAAKGSKGKKESELAEVKKAFSEAKGDLKDQNDDLTADTASLGQTKDSCQSKADEWAKRSKTRNLELEAMDMAIKILNKVAGVRTEAPDNAKMNASPVKFLQLSSVGVDGKQKAVNLLRETAKTYHSRSLERFAMEISAHLGGPFDQINNMVEKMIFRLMQEQTDEDQHKQWCDRELSKTNTMKDNKDDKIEELDAKLKSETAGVALLSEDVKAADEMISKIMASMQQATEIRKLGKQENKEAIADAEAAQKAILQAMDVLQAFYKDSGMIQEDDALFLEVPHKLPESPSTWDAGYNGVADPMKQPSGIIAVLKETNADFVQLESETRSQEAQDQQAFDKQIQKEEIEKARRTKEVEMKDNRKMQRSDAINLMTVSRRNVASEQAKAKQYLKDLQGACVTGDSSYEKRKAARKGEIEALQKAQGFLEEAFNKPVSFLSKTTVHVPM